MQKKTSIRIRIEQVIARSVEKQTEQKKEYRLFGKLFYLNEFFISDFDIQATLNEIESMIPMHLFEEVDEFLIGNFDFLQDRSLEAMYKDGAIYITNQLHSGRDLMENVIHEVSHSLEYKYGHYIYGDMRMHSEFIGKRKRLESVLQSEGIDTSNYNFSETEYEEEFDIFLYEDIGYPLLNSLSMGLFVSPYSVTSLREYWAVGFEDYFVGDREYVQKISPQLFNKIEGVLSYDN
jgi:hypothetical protein